MKSHGHSLQAELDKLHPELTAAERRLSLINSQLDHVTSIKLGCLLFPFMNTFFFHHQMITRALRVLVNLY